MKRAIQIAKNGQFSVAPNPMVGAVIVNQDKIIGEGYHQKYGEAHAEVNAINAVKNQSLLKESTLYVSLEPCSHQGKTPPCANLIVEKGFKRVVIANLDPSDKVAGKGIELLKKSGIEVVTEIGAKDGQLLNRRFFSLHKKKRPFVILKWASTADGYLGILPSDSKVKDAWITSALSKQLVHLWRAQEMGILVGKRTALQDDPELTVREANGKQPVRFLVDPLLEIPASAKVFDEAAPTVVLNTLKEGKKGQLTFLRYPKGQMIDVLFAYCLKTAIHSIIIEGGAFTLERFLDDGRWDEIRHFTGQKQFGQGVASPKINAELICTQRIRGDEYRFYLNPQA